MIDTYWARYRQEVTAVPAEPRAQAIVAARLAKAMGIPKAHAIREIREHGGLDLTEAWPMSDHEL